MSAVIGWLAVVLLLAMLYMAAAWATDWQWKAAARGLTLLLSVVALFLGLLALAAFGFTGSFG